MTQLTTWVDTADSRHAEDKEHGAPDVGGRTEGHDYSPLVPLKGIAGGVVWFYQNCVSPYNGSNCVFTPSCSQYVVDVIRKHGMIVGLLKASDRLQRCHKGNRFLYPQVELSNGEIVFDDPVD